MKNLLKVLMFFLLFLGVTGLWVLPSFAAEQKIAVVTMQKVMKESVAGKGATAELEKKFKVLQAGLKKQQDAVKAFKDEMDKKASLLSDEAKSEKDREYKKLLRELKEKSDDAQFEMRQEESKVMEPILKELEKVINNLAKEKDYSLILEYNMPGIYYASSTIDITNEVVKAYDKEHSVKKK
jgi:outer membrane protein